MPTCGNGCPFFQLPDFATEEGECCYDPPQLTSQGCSVRPEVLAGDVACHHHPENSGVAYKVVQG